MVAHNVFAWARQFEQESDWQAAATDFPCNLSYRYTQTSASNGELVRFEGGYGAESVFSMQSEHGWWMERSRRKGLAGCRQLSSKCTE